MVVAPPETIPWGNIVHEPTTRRSTGPDRFRSSWSAESEFGSASAFGCGTHKK